MSLSRWKPGSTRSDAPVLLLVGPSGAGKSSLMRLLGELLGGLKLHAGTSTPEGLDAAGNATNGTFLSVFPFCLRWQRQALGEQKRRHDLLRAAGHHPQQGNIALMTMDER